MEKVLMLAASVMVWMSVAAGSVKAGVEVTWKSYPTAGLAGYTTYIVSVESDVGVFKSFGVDFKTEHFNQICVNGIPTPTQTQNIFFQFIGEDPLQDTQIMIDHDDVEECFIPEGCIVETDTRIEGVQRFRQYQESWDLAQLVVPAGNTIDYYIGVVISSIDYQKAGVIPEPVSLAIMSVAGAVLLRRQTK